MERTPNGTNGTNGKRCIARAAGAAVLAAGLIAGGIWGFNATTAQGSGGTPGSGGTTSMTASADPERPASAEKATKAMKDSVPKPLANAGEYGENVYDAAKVGDWKTADQKVVSLRDSASQLTAGSSQERSALRSEITSLEKAVSQQEARTAQLESNQVTLTVAEMSAGYSNPVPVDVTKLDYLGRELEIWAASGNQQKLDQTSAQIQSTWQSVRPQVVANGGTAEAQKFDAIVQQVKQAQSPSQHGDLAKPVLDQVDYLEKVFA